MVKVLDLMTRDGSRRFGELTLGVDWHQVRDHVLGLPGASVTGFVRPGASETWIDFMWEGHAFTIHNDRPGEYRFCVADAACPEGLLRIVVEHFERLAAPS